MRITLITTPSIVNSPSISYSLTVNPPADKAYWNGTNSNDPNGPAIPPVRIYDYQSGATTSNFTYNYTSGQAGSYTRYVTFKDSEGNLMCTTTPPLNISIAVSPRITSLQVGQGGIPTGTGTVFGPGLQSTQRGVGWYNPMTVTLNASNTDASAKYYVAFYDKQEGTTSVQKAFSSLIDVSTGQPIASLKSLLNSGDYGAGYANGIILRYDSGTGKYYVWNALFNTWTDITDKVAQGYPICGTNSQVPRTDQKNCSTKIFYTVYPGSFTNSQEPHTWQIAFDKNYGGKIMYTPGYVVNSNGLSDFQSDIRPSPMPTP